MLLKSKFIVSAITAFALVFAQSASALTPPEPSQRLPFIRLYNPLINDHFYTTDWTESDNAQRLHGYKFEGTLGYVEKAPRLGVVSIIRLWNPGVRKHFYTISRSEMLQVQLMGYRLEGDLGNLFESAYQIQACPDEWIVNKMPGLVGDTAPKEYFIIDGVRRELRDFDLNWISQNCDIEKQEVY